jgi:hypothetical protein
MFYTFWINQRTRKLQAICHFTGGIDFNELFVDPAEWDFWAQESSICLAA